MKKKIKNNEYKVMITLGILLVFSGIIAEMFLELQKMISIILINIGTILLIIAVINKNKYGAGIRADERDIKISSRAVSYSWFYTFILINALFWIDYFNPKLLTVSQTIGIIFFFMIFSTAIIKQYFKNKGDVD